MTCDFCDRRPCRCDAPTLYVDDVISAIKEEEEFGGEMPQQLFDKISGDKPMMERAFRAAVKAAKQNIVRRVHALQSR